MHELEKYQNPQYSPQEYSETEVMISEPSSVSILKPILRRWYVVLVVVVLFCGGGIPAVWKNMQPVYTSTGAIEVAPILTNYLTGEQDRGEISNYESFMNTQVKLMSSQKVLQTVADQLTHKNLEVLSGETVPLDVLKIAMVNGTLTIAPAKHTHWIEIAMKSYHPEEAELVVNEFIRAYMEIAGTQEIAGGSKQIKVLRDERELLAQNIEQQREKLHELAQQYGNVSLDGRYDMMMQKITAIQTVLTDLAIRRMNLETQVMLLSQAQSQMMSPAELIRMRNDLINNDLFVRELTERIVQLRQEYLTDEQTMKATHPRLQEKADLIRKMEESLREREKTVAEQFDRRIEEELARTKEYDLARAQLELEKTKLEEHSYHERLAKEDSDTINLGNLQWQIRDLQEEMARSRELYDRYGDRIQQLEVEMKRPARISVADYASTAPPVDKRQKLTLALVLGALACGMALAFVWGRADQSLHSCDDVVKCIDVPIIGTTMSTSKKDRLLPQSIDHDYYNIRANLNLLSDGNMPRRLVVTSAGVGEGKTTFSINLAASFAKAGNKVLLIDGDVRKADVARALNLPNYPWGLQDVLLGLCRLEDAVQTIPTNGLDVLTSDSRNALETIESLTKPLGQEFMNSVSQRYDYVIIDTPPVLVVPDALLWAKLADAVVLSSFAGHTVGPELEKTLKRLTQMNIKVLGNVLSNVREKHSYFQYGYSYYPAAGANRRKKTAARPLMITLESPKNDPDQQQ